MAGSLVPALVALLAVGAAGQRPSGPAPADQPLPRTDRNSILAHAQLLAKAKQGRIDVYFAGDSIVRRWGATDYPELLVNWKRNFHGWNAANFAWGGDTTHNILWRLENGELDGITPGVIVLLAGTNNLGNSTPDGGAAAQAADIARGVQAIVRAMRTRAPEAVIILMGIFPRNDNAAVLPIIDAINRDLAAFADGKQVRFLNINHRLADANGRLRAGMSADGLHLTVRGYQVWADALKPLFTELLGPPGPDDYAPPPTGDPSAAGQHQ